MAVDLQLYIAGGWTDGTGDDAYEVRSPVTGEHIYTVPKASQADIDRAVASAGEAAAEMRHWTAFERADLCLRIYELWQERVDEVARILTLEQGKPFHAEAIDDIAESGDYFQIAAEDVKRLERRSDPDHRAEPPDVHRAPPGGGLGGDHPVELPGDDPDGVRRSGPGDRQRHDRQATRVHLLGAARDGEVFDEAGVPPEGAINVIPGGGDIGEALVTHPGIDAIGLHRVVGKRVAASSPRWV